ncbi:YeeE/YedE family protein [Methyloligella sp. 2.7D]|uniref:YeeE/YedE family protein n=1 Tax=unclassified Methyloligella TaxID=2625955 RepID=UPI00157DB897|nr:YeeE/YedE family protein [Methyloligella sp. GL2]QKP76129.1 YeeE/YedE family protein [Methyloligella sp. GL2]
MSILRIAAALLCGTMFGFGLSLSGMVDPSRVRGFLDIAGDWNPSLAFVLFGAVAVAMLGVVIRRAMGHPLFDQGFQLPSTTPIDKRLIGGSAIFGIGWGMAGLCPGPAIADLALGVTPIVVFVTAMVIGMLIHDRAVSSSSC